MRLAWHIARKDIGRLAVPVAAWLAFIVVTTVGFRLGSGLAGAGDDISLVTTWTVLLAGLQSVVGYLLAGAMVLEDPLVGTSGFWMTRPVANARLFLGKLLAAVLLFVVAPALALLPVWWLCRFPADAWLAAAGVTMFWQAAFTVLALAIASLSPTLRHFLLGSLGLALMYPLFGPYGLTAYWVEPLAPAIRGSRNAVLQFSVVPFLALILVQQFLTRKTRLGWALIAIGLTAAMAVQVAWPWDILPRFNARPAGWPAEARASDAGVAVTIERLEEPAVGEAAPLSVRIRGAGLAVDEYLAPLAGKGEMRWADGMTKGGLIWRGGAWADAAARQMWKAGARGEPLPWEMVFRLTPAAAARIRTEPASFQFEMLLARVRGRIVGKLPLKLGAEVSTGPARVRVAELSREGETLTVTFEQRDAAAHGFAYRPGPRGHPGHESGKGSCYLLVNASGEVLQTPAITQKGAVILNGLSLGFHAVVLSAPAREVNLEQDATLVLVTFEPQQLFTRTVTNERLALSPREKQP